MKQTLSNISRRRFLQHSVMASLATAGLGAFPSNDYAASATNADINLIGPRAGYSPQIGIMVSQLDWVRASVIRATKGLTQPELDYLADPQSNTIGALLLHLAATDVVYQDMTFHGLQDFSEVNNKKWGVAMELGDEGRSQIKGHDLDFYISAMTEVREVTLQEFKGKDDKWFAEVDPKFFGGPTNNFCKWFHVCEHEANHRGQMTVIRKHLPGNKPKGE
jgi:uncharacterized damage-inducible protein DinB